MAGNTFGQIFRLTTYGESHGPGLGGIVDGCPAGLPLDEQDIQKELDLRKPGQGPTGTARKESDTVHILSGVFGGRTTGTPIAFHVANTNQHSSDYDALARIFRPGHADYGYFAKYNGLRDHRGGGRSSGRETVGRVAGGAIAKKLLATQGIGIVGGCVEFGGLPCDAPFDLAGAQSRPYFAAHDAMPGQWDKLVQEARLANDTLGGLVRIEARNVPAGLGEPVFDKISALLAHAVMSVGAVKGVEIGDGFAAARRRGSQNNDAMLPSSGKPGQVAFASNHAGGILGGITSGQDIVLTCAVKPIASIPQDQQTVTVDGEATTIRIGGRHDLSAIPRIVPVLTAMTALVLADCLLLQQRMGLPG